jgi:hypothetical protein
MQNPTKIPSRPRRAGARLPAQTLLLVTGAIALFSGLGCGGGSESPATGTSGGTATTGVGGAGGSETTSTGMATSTGTGTGGAALDLSCANPPCLNVINKCPFPLWINANNNTNVTLQPDNAMLSAAGQSGSSRQYDVPDEWSAARVNAYWVDPKGAAPDPVAYDKVELTFTGGVMNYNITYVDYAALPSSMEAVGPACQKSANFDPRVGCDVKSDKLVSSCPDGLLDGKRCLSAKDYCSLGANKAKPYCHALDTQIAACEAQSPATCGVAAQLNDSTPNVYGCSGYFDSQPANCSPASASCHKDGNKWCAALNRGMLAQPESTDTTQFYKNAPYNTYSKWVHDTCPGIYAFPYDDYPSGAGESGFRACKADRLDITFCPGG